MDDIVEGLATMNIGILSMQRVVNYGSFLQAYALKGFLSNLGHECHFIDIRPGRKIITDSIAKNQNKFVFIIKRIDRYLLKRVKHKFFTKKRLSKFYNDFFPILGVNKEPIYDSRYDAVVIGSDEVFNCTQKAPWGFAKSLFGEGLDSRIIITYAASCGYTTLDDLRQYGIKEEVRNAMKNLYAISVRDKNTKRFAEELTGKEIYEHIDPTLIYDFNHLVSESVSEKNYILIYAYDGRINDKETIKKIKGFAKKNNKQVICAGVYQSWCDKQILCTPFELLSYFKNADYVITDTFHGTVFSIKYNKQFITIVRENNKQKIFDLLEKFNLIDRIIDSPNELINKLNTLALFDYANDEIQKNRDSALEYFSEKLTQGGQ